VSEPPIPELSIEIDGEPLKIPGDLPLLPVRSTVLFPGTTLPLAVGRPRSAAAVREAAGKGGFLAVVTQRKAEVDRPGPEDLYPEGVVTRILQVIDQGQGLSVMVLALARLKVVDLVEDNEFERVRIEIVHDRLDETAEAEAARRTVQRLAKEIIRLREDLPDELQEMVERLEDPGRLADLAAFGLNLSTDEKMQLLAQPDVVDRLRVLIRHLTREIRVAQVSKEFQRQAAGNGRRPAKSTRVDGRLFSASSFERSTRSSASRMTRSSRRTRSGRGSRRRVCRTMRQRWRCARRTVWPPSPPTRRNVPSPAPIWSGSSISRGGRRRRTTSISPTRARYSTGTTTTWNA
jgi:Lon protease-like protein